MPAEHSYPRYMMVQSFPLPFSHTAFLETQRKWGMTEQEAYGVYYAITKWNYYLQGVDIIVRNDHKPLTKFLNGKNANNKVNRWGLELTTYNITFEWISGAQNKAADCLSWLVELPQTTPVPINLLSITDSDGPAFNTRSQSHKCLSIDTSTVQPNVMPEVSKVPNPTPKSLTAEWLEALLQMQKNYPFAKEFPSAYQMEKYQGTKLIFSHTSEVYYTNMSQIQVRTFLL